MKRTLWLCLFACIACDDSLHDEVRDVDGGDDLSAPSVDDLSVAPDLTMAGLPSLVTSGHYFLAEEAQSGTLYGGEIIAPSGLSPIKLVSISTQSGAVVHLFDDPTAIINNVHTTPTHLYWIQHDTAGGGPGYLKWVKLDGTSPGVFFDATTTAGVPANYLIQNFVVAGDYIAVLVSDGVGFQIGQIPKETGTGYLAASAVMYPSATGVNFRNPGRDTLAYDGTSFYAAGIATFASGPSQGFVEKFTGASAAPIWNVANAVPHAITATATRVYWSDNLGNLIGYDGMTTGTVGAIIPSIQQLTPYMGDLYGAGDSTPPPTMLMEKLTPPMMFDGTGMFTTLRTIGECLDVDMGCIAKSPTFAIDGGVIYHTTTDGLYRLPL